MKITAKNSNLGITIVSTQFTNLAGTISAAASQGYFTVTGSDGVFTCKNTAISSVGYAYSNFNIGSPLARDGKTYYICFEIEMVSNSGDSAATNCITKFNGTSNSGTMTYPTSGKTVIGAEVTAPSSGDANLSQVVLQHGKQLAAGTVAGAIEYKISNIAIVDKSACSFSNLDACINYLKTMGFASVAG